MNAAHLNRMLKLVRTTAEHVIVADPETDDLFVIMHLDEYENLCGISSDDDGDLTLNVPDIAVRPASRPSSLIPGAPFMPVVPAKKDTSLAEVPVSDHLDFTDDAWKNDWESAFLAEHPEVAPTAELESEEEEEKFYLEPLE